jgi:hypothetical protein
MAQKLDRLLQEIRDVSVVFIGAEYPRETAYLDAALNAFAQWAGRFAGGAEALAKLPLRVLVSGFDAGLGAFDEQGVDVVTPILLGTVAKTMVILDLDEPRKRKKPLSDLVAEIAVGCGARGGLLAELTSRLPGLCEAVRAARSEVKEAYISTAQSPQYQVWTDRETKFVESIASYEERKDGFLFWINVSANEFKSLGELRPDLHLTALSISVLRAIGEVSGCTVKWEDLAKKIWEKRKVRPKGNIEVELTRLEKFSRHRLRNSFLGPGESKNELTVKTDFAKCYCIVKRLR